MPTMYSLSLYDYSHFLKNKNRIAIGVFSIKKNGTMLRVWIDFVYRGNKMPRWALLGIECTYHFPWRKASS